jgi:hypothetical protein
VEKESRVHTTTSFQVDVTSPTMLGTPAAPLPDTQHSVSLTITAIDDQGATDTTFNGKVQLYANFLGSLSPARLDPSATQLMLTNGTAQITLMLPLVFGPTYVWVEDAEGDTPTYATGTSATLYYRLPYLEDISRPLDETAPDALSNSPLNGKQVTITSSKHGATNGKLVVTGVYAQGYTLSDADCTTKPCTVDPYGSIFVFSFGRPLDTTNRPVEVGDTVAGVGGGVGEFNGFTELNFPVTTLTADMPDLTIVPTPTVIDPAWLNSTVVPGPMINLERVESGLIEADNGVMCPLDSDYTTYQQWKLNIGAGCGEPINVITFGQVTNFDPTPYVGKTFPKVIGTLKAVNIGTFNVWIILPRTMADITLPP